MSESETELIEGIRNGLPPGVDFDEREETILSLAARQARDVKRAEADLEERGYLVPDSQGQQVVNPSLSEARQGRVVLGRSLGRLDLPESTPGMPSGAPDTPLSRAGRGLMTRLGRSLPAKQVDLARHSGSWEWIRANESSA